jgi:hypothetical protein
VNKIRPRVRAWREADDSGASGITKRLLQHWGDTEQRDSNRRFFFCQLEAIETLIWLTEAPASEAVLRDGDRFRQDDLDGHADCVAGSQQSYVSTGLAFLEEYSADCAGADREKQAASACPRNARQLLHGASNHPAQASKTSSGKDRLAAC